MIITNLGELFRHLILLIQIPRVILNLRPLPHILIELTFINYDVILKEPPLFVTLHNINYFVYKKGKVYYKTP